MRVLVDVDGVVADLMGGFERYIRERHGLELRPREITVHRISMSPAHRELHERIDLNLQLERFLAVDDVYDRYVEPITGAVETVLDMHDAGHEVGFVTATLHESPESYAPKYRWLARHFGRMPVISCPAGQKHWFRAHYGIDDRYDTCQRWSQAGITPLLFRQPWNEAPPGTAGLDWSEIRDFVFPGGRPAPASP